MGGERSGLEDGVCIGGAREEKGLVGEKPGVCAAAGAYEGVGRLVVGWFEGLTMALVARLPWVGDIEGRFLRGEGRSWVE